MSPTIILLGVVAQFLFIGIRFYYWRKSPQKASIQGDAATVEAKKADTTQCVRLFGELRGLMLTHLKVLRSTEAVHAGKKSVADATNSIAQDAERRRVIPLAIHNRVDQLGQVLEPYNGLYASECEQMRSYATKADELELLVNTAAKKNAGTDQPLLKLIADMLEENNQLRATIDKCQEKISDLIGKTERASRDARVDLLTQLPNRRAWSEEVPTLESRGDLFLAMIDIDHFKVVNDTHGHAAGDATLQMLARVFRDVPSARIFRLGGDEFLMFFRSRSAASAERTVNELREKVQRCSVQIDGLKLSATISCGLTNAIEGEAIDSVVARADEALYSAKQNGRNFVVFRPGKVELSIVRDDDGVEVACVG